MNKMKIDPEILEKLWNGNLYVAEQCYPQDQEYRKLTQETGEIHAQLLKLFPEDSKAGELLERYEKQTSILIEKEHLEAFKMGFSMALSMAAEVWSGKEDT